MLKHLHVLQVQEFFGDFVVMDPQHFCIPLPRPHVVLQPFSWDYANSTDAVTRMTEGLASLTLSLRRRFNIRSVDPASNLARSVQYLCHHFALVLEASSRQAPSCWQADGTLQPSSVHGSGQHHVFKSSLCISICWAMNGAAPAA